MLYKCYPEFPSDSLDVITLDVVAVEEGEFRQYIEVDSFSLKIRNALFRLKDHYSVDTLNLLHYCGAQKLLDDSSHEEFFQTESYFDCNLA